MLKKLSELHVLAKKGKTRKLVLAAAHDANAMDAALKASKEGVIDLIMVGDKKKILEIASERNYNIDGLQIIDKPNNDEAAAVSVKMVSSKEADILMKGNIGTASLLRAVLNKEWGLRTGELLSHLAIFELPTYHKIIGLTDAAMNIAPDLQGKISLIRNSVNYFRSVGIEEPKVALLSAVETVNPDMKSTVDASLIAKMGHRKQIKNCIIDGPLAFDNAVSAKSSEIKGIDSPVAGDADILVGDDIDASNGLYKAFIYFASAKCAAVIVGAAAPIVLTSRADNDETKLNSIAMAAAIK